MKNTYGKRNSSILNDSYTRQKKVFQNLKNKMTNYKLRLSVTDSYNDTIIEENNKTTDKENNKLTVNKQNNYIHEKHINKEKELQRVGSIIAQTLVKNSNINNDDTLCLLKNAEFAKYSDEVEATKTISMEKGLSIEATICGAECDTSKQIDNTNDLIENDFNIPGLTLLSNETNLYDEIYIPDVGTTNQKKDTSLEFKPNKTEDIYYNHDDTQFRLSTCFDASSETKKGTNKDNAFNLSVSNIENSLYYDYESDISIEYIIDKNVKKIRLDCIPNNLFFENYLKLETRPFKSLRSKNIEKINEATFSDVYLIENKIYKIISFNDMTEEEFYKETFINKVLSRERGIIRLYDCFFVEGCYPRYFIRAWERYDKKYNKKPKSGIHKYGVLVMEHGGVDLESFVFLDQCEVEYFLYELVFILEELEDKYEFEHRDLHWGNILIDRIRVKDNLHVNLENGNYPINSSYTRNDQTNDILKPKQRRTRRKNNVDDDSTNLNHTSNCKYKKEETSRTDACTSIIENKPKSTSNKGRKKVGRPKLSDQTIYQNDQIGQTNKKMDDLSENDEKQVCEYNDAKDDNKRKNIGHTKKRLINTEQGDILRSKQNWDIKNRKTNNKYKPFEINIIDFTLSRIKYHNKIIYTDLTKKSWLFEGNESEDLQYGIYKKMKREEYVSFDDQSNFLWFGYIVEKVMSKSPKYQIFKNLTKQMENCNSIKELAEEIRYLMK